MRAEALEACKGEPNDYTTQNRLQKIIELADGAISGDNEFFANPQTVKAMAELLDMADEACKSMLNPSERISDSIRQMEIFIAAIQAFKENR
jgi:chemotaxis protein CheY-P-specific phosphatase CheC